MSNLDRRIARLEQASELQEIKDIDRMTRQERDQCMIEILTPYVGEEKACEHVHRLRTDPAYAQDHARRLRELAEQAGIIPRR